MPMKACHVCKVDKPFEAFYIRRDRNTPASRCKQCSAEAYKIWRYKRPNYEKDRYQAVKEVTRERHLIRKYGVTLADYERMLASQNGSCAICGSPESAQPYGVFHVDHCHQGKQVRGLLCWGCNALLGMVNDDPEKLKAAIAYLGRPQIPEMLGRAIMEAAA